MPDNMDHFDEAFWDQGWEDMRQRLDAAMPQERRRIAFFWWWSSAAAVLLVVALWPSNGGKQLGFFPVASSGVPTDEQVVAETGTVSVVTPTGEILESNSSEIVKKEGEAVVRRSAALDALPSGRPIAIPNVPLTLPAIQLVPSEPPLPMLAGMQPRLLPETFRLDDPVLPKTKRRPRLYASAGLWNQFDQDIGFYGGIAVEQALNARLGTDVALAYEQQQHRFQEDAVLFSAVAAEEDAPGPVNPDSSDPGTTASSRDTLFLNSPIRTARLSLPLHVSYEITPRFRLNAGARLSRLLSTELRLPTDEASFDQNRFFNLDNFQADANNQISVRPTRDWVLGYEAGLSYQFARRTGISLGYRYESTRWLPEDLPGIRRSQWTVGLHYRLW